MDRAAYFQEIDGYLDAEIRRKAIKIKVADRYDNLIGLSFTSLDKKKDQYRREVNQFFIPFAKEISLSHLIDQGMQILDGELSAPDINITSIEFID